MNTIQKEDRGPYIRTFTGRKFFPLTPRPDDFSVEDIAMQLARVPRWGGASSKPYNVAQHSIWCAEDGLAFYVKSHRLWPQGLTYLQHDNNGSARYQTWRSDPSGYLSLSEYLAQLRRSLLFHDVSEAYICDIPRPIKSSLTGYQEIESGIMKAAAERFGFEWPLNHDAHTVDMIALVAERLALFTPGRRHLEDFDEPILVKGVIAKQDELVQGIERRSGLPPECFYNWCTLVGINE